MRTINLPQPPSSWMALSKEQLIHIQSIPSDMPEIQYKMIVFLYLAGMELCKKSYFPEPNSSDCVDAPLPDKDAPLKEREERLDAMIARLDWMEDIMNGTADMTIVLRNLKAVGTEDEYLQIDSLRFFDVVRHCTKFLDEPFGLLDNKLGIVTVGEHKYKCPDPLIMNLTYEQYQNASFAISAYLEAAKQLKDCKLNSPKAKAIVEQYKDAQARFLSQVLTLMKPQSFEDEVVSPVLHSSKKVKRTYLAPSYVAAEAAQFVDEMRKAPEWLFPILFQQFQSSLMEYKKKFPKVFTDKKNGTASDPLLATAGTLNTLMKEQGYYDQQAVLNANAIFNLKILDDLTRRAEEIEKMNKELKIKKK